MKKITLLCAILLCSMAGFSQVVISENFDTGTPVGWTGTYANTATNSCAGNSERDNIYSTSATGNITTSNQAGASNATDLTISFDYKVIDYGGGGATAAGWGSADLQYSTNDGATWNTVLTIDDGNHVVAATCATITPVVIAGVSLPMGSDIKLQITNTWVAGDYYFYVDNFTATQVVSSVPNCATNSVSTPDVSCGNYDTTISWDATAGVLGYYLTVGTSPGGTEILNNIDVGTVVSYVIGTQSFNTTYYWTIVPFNSLGPATGCVENNYATFVTGCYCTSNPSSNDNNGISNVQLGATDFPTTDVTYFDHTVTIVDLGQGITANTQITFETGYTYDTHIWIDFNDDLTFDVSELVYSGVSLDTNPITLNASFTMPGAAPLGNHRMRIGTADAGQATPDPCYSDTYGVTLDFMVNIITVACTPAIATPAVVADCGNNQFFVDVNVTAVGDATEITDTVSTWPIFGIGIVQVGPFVDDSSVNLTISHTDAACDIALGSFSNLCPPTNNDCANVTALTTGANFSQNSVIGTLVGATDSGIGAPSCSSFGGGDVWYSIVVPADGNIDIETNNNGSTLSDTAMEVYSGTCGALVSVECDDDDSADGNFSLINLTGRTPGETLYLRVWEYNGGTEDTFQVSAYSATLSIEDLQLTESFKFYPNPVNDVLNISAKNNIEKLQIVNMLGQVVKSTTPNMNKYQLDLSDLTSGIYFIRASINNTEGTFRVVKK